MTVDHDVVAMVQLPDEFFQKVLPEIRDLGELKIVLHLLRIAGNHHSQAVTLDQLLAPEVIRSVASAGSPEPAEVRLRRTLDRAVANGSLLRVTVRREHGAVTYFLPPWESNRNLIDRLCQADPEAAQALDLSPQDMAIIYRPNIYAFYEQHIGPLTPLLADQLRDAERSYPRSWIEEAILAAVQYNKRNWRYVETILARWEKTGGPDGVTRRHP